MSLAAKETYCLAIASTVTLFPRIDLLTLISESSYFEISQASMKYVSLVKLLLLKPKPFILLSLRCEADHNFRSELLQNLRSSFAYLKVPFPSYQCNILTLPLHS